jgi:hypothetical protein
VASTLQTAVDLGRYPLNDAKDSGGSDAICRYKDVDLLRFLLHGLLQAFRMRGDLFVGSFSNPPSLSWTATQPWPLGDEYIQIFADYVTARAETVDDEAIVTERAAQFYQLFGAEVPS